jgi:hypothetical protein
LLPTSQELPESQIDSDGNGRDLIFPVLNGRSRDPEFIRRLLLRVTHEFAPFFQFKPIHGKPQGKKT